MRVTKIEDSSVSCPYCGRLITGIIKLGEEIDLDKKIKCTLCRRTFKLSDLPDYGA